MNDKLCIQDLTDALAEKHGMDKHDAENFVKEFFQLIEEALEKDKYVKVKGLGAFKLIDVDSRESVDVNTGERIKIEEHTKVSFTPDAALKEAVNRPFAHFETVVLNENTVFEDTTTEDNNADEEEEVETPPIPIVKTPVAETPVMTEAPAMAEVPVVPEEAEKVGDSSMKYFAAIVVFIVLICAGAVTFLYYPDWRSWLEEEKSEEKAEVEQLVADTPAETPAPTPAAVLQDTAVAPSAEPLKQPAEKPLPKKQSEPQAQATAKVAPKNDTPKATPKTAPKAAPEADSAQQVQNTSNYVITGTQATYTVKQGETLTRVALRFYGTKALWPYIVMHNEKTIKNPNNVPYGTKLKIPKLEPKKP